MRLSIVGVVALACVAGACNARQSIYFQADKDARSERPAGDSQAARTDKPTTTTAATTEPRAARPGA